MSIQKYKLKNGEFRYKVRVLMEGRGSKHIARRFNKRSDAEAFLHEVKNRKRKQKLKVHNIMDFEETTFKDEAFFWLEAQGRKFSPSHLKRVKAIVYKLLPRFGKLKPSELYSGRIVQLQNEYLSKGLSPATANRNVEVLLAILNYSVRHKRIPYHPAQGVQKLKEDKMEVQVWEENEAREFLEWSDHCYLNGSEKRWIHLVYLLALNTGLRAGELWGLKVRDLLHGGELISVNRQFDRVVNQLRTTKGRRPRKVPCNPTLRSELLSWIQKKNLERDDLIFQTEAGGAIYHDNFIKRIFNIDLSRSGLRRIRFHDLRHTSGTLMVSAGVDIVTVKEILGHQDLKTTMMYVHLLGSNLRKVAQSYSLEPRKNAGLVKLIPSR